MKYRNFLLAVSSGLCLCAVSLLQAAKPPLTAHWVCAGPFERQLDREVASVNVKQYRERFLAGTRDAVHRAMFVFPASYKVMRAHLQSVSEKRFGQRELTEMTALDVFGLSMNEGGNAGNDKAHRGTSALTPKRKAKVRAAFEAAGMRAGSTAATRILTNKYNTVPSKDGWSELEILVVDGKAILGEDSTLVIMTRRDSAKQWGLATSGNPFSFGRNRVQSAFVTSTEFKLMQRLGKLYRIPFEVFPIANQTPIAGSVDAWRAAKDWLQAYMDDAETKGAKAPGHC
ncbi:MAG: hypothetical protein MJE12_23235 [Alphaproteobacteria bacterium]|nr:hypothetical protein [Alphaproteobacteria bacterium]